MGKLVSAWDKTTGARLPNLVPEDWIGHPILGVGLTGKPPGSGKLNKKNTIDTSPGEHTGGNLVKEEK